MKNPAAEPFKKIVITGIPNSGKSSVFSRLTGTEVISANYPGSTVELKKSIMHVNGSKYEVTDTPGIFSTEGGTPAELAVIKIFDDADILMNVVDSTNLERNLHLTLELLQLGKPAVIVLNFWDETKHNGIDIDAKRLEKILGVPVIPVCAISGEGVKDLVLALAGAGISSFRFKKQDIWKEIGIIIGDTQKVFHKHHSFAERLSDITIKSATGLPLAAAVLMLLFILIRFIAESLINNCLDPLFNNVYMPFLHKICAPISIPFIRELLLGKSGEAMTSFGILTTGLYVPFVSVLPYIFSFYLALSFLEDTGYLPRLAVLLDNIFHKLGLHGFSSIPVVLGLGCKVPALLSLRMLGTEREKVLTAVLILMSAPCMPQSAMIFSVGAKYGAGVLMTIFGVLFVISVTTSVFLNKLVKGETPELFMEMPPYRIPGIGVLAGKLWFRIKDFLFEAVPMIFFGVFVIDILDIIGFIAIISRTLGIVTSAIMGVPAETGVVMILGFLRKDMSISMLAPLNLTAKQFIIASIFMVMYLPCFATFFTLIKELGMKIASRIFILMFSIAIALSALLNIIIR